VGAIVGGTVVLVLLVVLLVDVLVVLLVDVLVVLVVLVDDVVAIVVRGVFVVLDELVLGSAVDVGAAAVADDASTPGSALHAASVSRASAPTERVVRRIATSSHGTFAVLTHLSTSSRIVLTGTEG
jgi:hypothetical protein